MNYRTWHAHNPFQIPEIRKSEGEVQWITVGGAHIPIEPGQSKADAIKQHLGDKGDKKEPKGSKAIKPEHVEKLHEKAAVAKKEIDSDAHKIADKYGVTVKEAPLKKAERIIEKAINDYGGDISKVKDVARNTVITGHQYLEEVIKELKEHGGFVSHKQQKSEDFHGYSGHIINVKAKNGHIAEIQINTPEMIYAKEKPADSKAILGAALFDKIKEKTGIEPGLGHEYYEKIRSRDTSEKDRAQHIKDSHKYYNDVREKTKGLHFK